MDGLPDVKDWPKRGLATFLLINLLFLVAAHFQWIQEELFSTILNSEFALFGGLLTLGVLGYGRDKILGWSIATLGLGEMLVSLSKLAGSDEGFLIFAGEVLWFVNRLLLIALVCRLLLPRRYETTVGRFLVLVFVACALVTVVLNLNLIEDDNPETTASTLANSYLDFVTASLDWSGRAALGLLCSLFLLRKRPWPWVFVAMAVLLVTEQLNSIEYESEYVLLEGGFFLAYGLILYGLWRDSRLLSEPDSPTGS